MHKSNYELMEELINADPWEVYTREQIEVDTILIEKFYYLASPYSKYPRGLETAYHDACKIPMFLQENGLHIFSHIVHSHGPSYYAEDPNNKTSHDFWLTIDFKWVKLSRGLIVCMLESWKESYGISKEIELANSLGKPVYYTEYLKMPNI